MEHFRGRHGSGANPERENLRRKERPNPFESFASSTALITRQVSKRRDASLAGLIVTFFSGICLEQNLGPDRARITKKIDAFMRLIRAI